jgi:hypothetical protein
VSAGGPGGSAESGLDAPLARARAFVETHGDALDRSFVAVLLRETPAPALLEALAARQEASGSIADVDAPPGLAATLRALERLDAVGLLDHPVVEAAVDFVAGHQDRAGAFAAAAGDDEAARIAWTGAAAGLLAKTPFARPSLLRRAEGWMRERWSVERVQGPTYAPILAYTHLLTQVDSELADEALQWCGRELERGLRTGAFGPLPVARVLLRARAGALPGARIEAQELVVGLITAQAPDGRFPAEADAPAVRATLEGIEALLRLGFRGEG